MSSNKVTKILEEITSLTLLEASELATQIKDKLNLPDFASAAPVAAAPSAQVGGDAGAKTSFNVKFLAFADPGAKIKGIKGIAETLELPLAEAKKKSESPFVVKEGCSKDEAESLKAKLEECGCSIALE